MSSNRKSKQRFIDVLAQYFINSHRHVQVGDDDADVAFVRKALQISALNNVRVISDDTDGLILLIHHTRQPTHSGYDIDIVGLCHSLSGCDTISGLLGFGKVRFYKSKILEKMPILVGEI